MDFGLRPMRPQDIAQLMEIEREAFPTTWPPTPFKQELGSKLASYLVVWAKWDEQAANYVPQSLRAPITLIRRLLAYVRGLFTVPSEVVHEGDEFIAGYVGLWFMADEAHITSIAVREAYRRLGLGELLMVGSIELAMARGSTCITLEARVSNFPAHALYEKYEFQKTGVRKAYYSDNREDAVIMTAESIHSPHYRDLFHDRMGIFHQRYGETVRILV